MRSGCMSVLRSKKIVYRVSEILFAAEIAFRRLDGGMPQQELNLLKLAPRCCGTASHRFFASHAVRYAPSPTSRSRS